MQFTIVLLIVAVAISQAKLLPASAAMKPVSSTTLKVVSVRGGALVSKETFVKVCASPRYTYWPMFSQH